MSDLSKEIDRIQQQIAQNPNTVTLDHDGSQYLVEDGALTVTLEFYGKRFINAPDKFLSYAKRQKVNVSITPAAQAELDK